MNKDFLKLTQKSRDNYKVPQIEDIQREFVKTIKNKFNHVDKKRSLKFLKYKFESV